MFVNSQFWLISHETAVVLVAALSVEEVEMAVWVCGNERDQGSDGFTFKFLKTFYDLMKMI